MNMRTAMIAVICLLASAQAAGREIVVAQVAAFTGAQASSGKAIRAGIKLYFDHVNQAGGVGGDRLTLIAYDDGYKSEETVRLVKEVLAKEAPMAFIGVLGTANNEAIIKDGVLARANVPLVGAISGASTMIGAPNIFVTKASYRDEVRRLFELLALIGINRVAIVYQDDGFGKDIVSGAEQAAPATRMNLVVKAPYERNTTNVRSAVQAVLKSDAQVVYLGAVTSAAAEFVRRIPARPGHGADLRRLGHRRERHEAQPEWRRARRLRLRRALAAHHRANLPDGARISAARPGGEGPRSGRAFDGGLYRGESAGSRAAAVAFQPCGPGEDGARDEGHRPRRVLCRLHTAEANRIAVRRVRHPEQGRTRPAMSAQARR